LVLNRNNNASKTVYDSIESSEHDLLLLPIVYNSTACILQSTLTLTVNKIYVLYFLKVTNHLVLPSKL